MKPTVTLYSKPDCQKCDVAKIVLAHRGYEVRVLTLGKDYTKDELLVIAPGTIQLPVLVVDGEVKKLSEIV